MGEKTVLLEYLGDSPAMRIMDFLLDNRLFDYSKKQIIEGAGIGKVTFYTYWPRLEKAGFVKATRKFGKTTLYKLNENNPVIEELKKIEFMLIKETAPKKMKIAVKSRRAAR